MHPIPPDTEVVYAGFWSRVWAFVIDSALVMMVIGPVVVSLYGWEYFLSPAAASAPVRFLVSYVLPALAVLVFWIYRSATPGKMAIRARIVDATTGGQPSTRQLVGRYLGYYLATLPLGVGLLWVAFDGRKQGWHDKLAGTVVIRFRRVPPGHVAAPGEGVHSAA